MSSTLVEAPSAEVRRQPNVLVAIVAVAALAAQLAMAPSLLDALRDRGSALAVFVALTLVLHAVSIEVSGRESTSFAGVGLLAIGFSFGVGPAVATGALVGVAKLVVRRGRLNRGVFDAAQFMLAAAAGAAVYAVVALTPAPEPLRPPSRWRGVHGRRSGAARLAIGRAERPPPLDVWRERFRWLTPYYLVAGPLAYALTSPTTRWASPAWPPSRCRPR